MIFNNNITNDIYLLPRTLKEEQGWLRDAGDTRVEKWSKFIIEYSRRSSWFLELSAAGFPVLAERYGLLCCDEEKLDPLYMYENLVGSRRPGGGHALKQVLRLKYWHWHCIDDKRPLGWNLWCKCSPHRPLLSWPDCNTPPWSWTYECRGQERCLGRKAITPVPVTYTMVVTWGHSYARKLRGLYRIAMNPEVKVLIYGLPLLPSLHLYKVQKSVWWLPTFLAKLQRCLLLLPQSWNREAGSLILNVKFLEM